MDWFKGKSTGNHGFWGTQVEGIAGRDISLGYHHLQAT